MRWIDMQRLVAGFCTTDKGTVQAVRDEFIPKIEAEADLLERCDKEYVSVGLPAVFAESVINLRLCASAGKARLQNACL